MIAKIFIVIALLVAAVLIAAAFKPNTFRIQRSIGIQAPPEKIFPLLDDLHNWSRWEPQDREDPTVQRRFSGPASGSGAASEWSSTGKAGRGRMLITESEPPARVLVVVDFTKPFQAHNFNEFTLEPRGAETQLTWTWTMQGRILYLMKVMGLFVNVDKAMGRHFEAGLRNLKTIAEQ